MVEKNRASKHHEHHGRQKKKLINQRARIGKDSSDAAYNGVTIKGVNNRNRPRNEQGGRGEIRRRK